MTESKANKLSNIVVFILKLPAEGGVPASAVCKHSPHKLPKVRMCVCVCVCVCVFACKKGTKRNACDDPSNVKKQAKVDLHRFVTTKLQALYA